MMINYAAVFKAADQQLKRGRGGHLLAVNASSDCVASRCNSEARVRRRPAAPTLSARQTMTTTTGDHTRRATRRLIATFIVVSSCCCCVQPIDVSRRHISPQRPWTHVDYLERRTFLSNSQVTRPSHERSHYVLLSVWPSASLFQTARNQCSICQKSSGGRRNDRPRARGNSWGEEALVGGRGSLLWYGQRVPFPPARGSGEAL